MDNSKYKSLYLQETFEHLAGVEKALLSIEKGQWEADRIDGLFRHFHSIKGMSASMGYKPVTELAHVQEELLDRLRSKRMSPDAAMAPALLRCLDKLKELVGFIAEDKTLEVDISPYVKTIRDIIEGKSPGQGEAPGPAEGAELKLPHVMKVEGRVFDGLLATVGDLLMAFSSFKALTHETRSIKFRNGLHMLGKSINAIHGSILEARMLPISDLTEGLPRVIRDISKTNGKEVGLKIEGEELSLDRSILESLGAPLVHIIRNAVDHGIEPVSERVQAGKQAQAAIHIKAYGKKDKVAIEVSDDGKGIDRAMVKKKAIENGMPEEKVLSLSDRDVLMLVCLPGLSAAERVTEISGRGVGMDIVKGTVEGLGGTIEIESVPGKGTKIIMELPRTSSIIKTLIINVEDELFLVPVSSIIKVIDVEADIAGDIISFNGTDVPVIPLARQLGLPEGRPEKDIYTVLLVEGPGNEKEQKVFAGLKIDNFGGEIDAYVKPLVPPLSKLWGVSGISIMGNGKPVFLLDLPQIIARAFAKRAG